MTLFPFEKKGTVCTVPLLTCCDCRLQLEVEILQHVAAKRARLEALQVLRGRDGGPSPITNKKKRHPVGCLFFLVGEAGLEPARPQ